MQLPGEWCFALTKFWLCECKVHYIIKLAEAAISEYSGFQDLMVMYQMVPTDSRAKDVTNLGGGLYLNF